MVLWLIDFTYVLCVYFPYIRDTSDYSKAMESSQTKICKSAGPTESC